MVAYLGRWVLERALVQRMPQAPKEIRLIHGERDARETLKPEIETWAHQKRADKAKNAHFSGAFYSYSKVLAWPDACGGVWPSETDGRKPFASCVRIQCCICSHQAGHTQKMQTVRWPPRSSATPIPCSTRMQKQ